MNTKKKGILYWQLGGFFFIIVVGSLLHFTYEWSGKLAVVAIFSAVNESVWEHLKLGYWPLFFFSLVEYKFLKNKVSSFFFAQFIGIMAMEIFIVVFFYSYTSIIGHNILWVDIGSFIIGALICQFLGYVLIDKKINKKAENYSLFFFLLLGLLFAIFTFYPPDLPIFRE